MLAGSVQPFVKAFHSPTFAVLGLTPTSSVFIVWYYLLNPLIHTERLTLAGEATNTGPRVLCGVAGFLAPS